MFIDLHLLNKFESLPNNDLHFTMNCSCSFQSVFNETPEPKMKIDLRQFDESKSIK